MYGLSECLHVLTRRVEALEDIVILLPTNSCLGIEDHLTKINGADSSVGPESISFVSGEQPHLPDQIGLAPAMEHN